LHWLGKFCKTEYAFCKLSKLQKASIAICKIYAVLWVDLKNVLNIVNTLFYIIFEEFAAVWVKF